MMTRELPGDRRKIFFGCRGIDTNTSDGMGADESRGRMRGKGRQSNRRMAGTRKQCSPSVKGRWNRKPGPVSAAYPFPGRRVAKCNLSAPALGDMCAV